MNTTKQTQHGVFDMDLNPILSKPFWHSLLWMQNKHHRHGVLVHTLRVVYYTVRHRDFKMLFAAVLHDIGKPFVAYQKPEDVVVGEYSFSDHEEAGYQIIKNWPFVSDYTMQIVRWHYLIRDIRKHKTKDPQRAKVKQEIWEKLDIEMQEDLKRFLKYDDLGKGR